jgi:hypothetical protein
MKPTLKLLLIGEEFGTFDQATWEAIRKAIGEHDRSLLRHWQQREVSAGIDGQYLPRVARAIILSGYALILA